jgi:hypothetical protein
MSTDTMSTTAADSERGSPAKAGATSRELRRAFFKAVTPQDVADITRKLIELAKTGDVKAAALLLDRLERSGDELPESLDELAAEADRQISESLLRCILSKPADREAERNKAHSRA